MSGDCVSHLESNHAEKVNGTHRECPWWASVLESQAGWWRTWPSVFHRSSVTWSSRDGVEEVTTVEIGLLGLFQMRQKPHLSSPEKVGQRLWVKVMTCLDTLFLCKDIHKQLLECMIMFAQSWQKWGSHWQGIFWLRFLCCNWFPEIKDMTWTLFTQIVGLKTKFPRRLSASRRYENGLMLSSFPLSVNVGRVTTDHREELLNYSAIGYWLPVGLCWRVSAL